MLEIYPERGGDPDRAGQEGPARLRRLARPPRGRAVAGTARWGPGRPGWHIECTAIAQRAPRRRLRRPGRRQRPGLPAPRDVRRPRPGRRSAGHAVREGLQPRRDGRLRRREDVEVAGQPGLRLGAAQQRRRPDGDPAGAAAPPLPRPTGSGLDGELWDAVDDLGRWRRALSLGAGAPAAPVVDRGAGRAGRRPRRAPRGGRRRGAGSPPPSAPTALADTCDPDAALQIHAVLDAALGLAL